MAAVPFGWQVIGQSVVKRHTTERSATRAVSVKPPVKVIVVKQHHLRRWFCGLSVVWTSIPLGANT